MDLVGKIKAAGLASSALLLAGCGSVGNQYNSVEVFETPIRGQTGNPNHGNLRMTGTMRDNKGQVYEVWVYEDRNGKTHTEYLPQNTR